MWFQGSSASSQTSVDGVMNSYSGETKLHLAAKDGNAEEVENLLVRIRVSHSMHAAAARVKLAASSSFCPSILPAAPPSGVGWTWECARRIMLRASPMADLRLRVCGCHRAKEPMRSSRRRTGTPPCTCALSRTLVWVLVLLRFLVSSLCCRFCSIHSPFSSTVFLVPSRRPPCC